MKKTLTYALAIIALFSVQLRAEKPTAESLEKLLIITDTQKTLESVMGSMDQQLKAGMQASLGGRELSEEQQNKLNSVQGELLSWMEEEMSWDKMKGLYFSVYEQVFDQNEIDGLIEFYESETGKAFVKKQPMVIQQTMMLMQQRMGPMIQRLQTRVQETMNELEAMDHSGHDHGSHEGHNH